MTGTGRRVAYLVAEVAHLTRERDAALEALRRARAEVAAHNKACTALNCGHADRAFHAIETGAIHDATTNR